MSNIYTYQIDERNLRVQLKSMETLLKEEALHKFEAYAEANPFKQQKGRFANFEVNLSRGVVLPAVFGVIIFLFSFLLFNFITIKDAKNEKVQNVASADFSDNQAVTDQVVKQEELLPQVSDKTSEMENPQPTSTIEKPVMESQAVSESVIEPEVIVAEQARTEAIIKQKRRKKAEEEELSAIKPTIVSDEDEPLTVPN